MPSSLRRGKPGVLRSRSVRWLVIAIVLFPLLGAIGLIGAGNKRFAGERFISKFVVVQPAGELGLRITEEVYVDFGLNRRHGYERLIPDDFGTPVDVAATSTANAAIEVRPAPDGTLIRIGSPDESFFGRHRYTLSYTLPAAERPTGSLRLNIAEPNEVLATGRFEVVVDGFEMSDPSCSTGPPGFFGGCELTRRDDGTYRAVIAPLETRNGITIGGDRLMMTRPTADLVPSGSDGLERWQVALILLVVGVGVAAVFFGAMSWLGANRVAAGDVTNVGSADEAGGSTDAKPDISDHGGAEVRRVADADLDELATVRPEPPDGIRPWHGVVLINEVIDRRSVGAWLAEMLAKRAIIVDDRIIEVSAELAELDLDEYDRRWIAELFGKRPRFNSLTATPAVGAVWNSISLHQQIQTRETGWWDKRPPTERRRRGDTGPNWSLISFNAVMLAVVAVIFRQAIGPLFGWLVSVLSFLTGPLWSAIGLTVFGVGFAAWKVGLALLPVRSVAGSAATLQVLSFRNFLTDSGPAASGTEAWDRSRVSDYNGWAVALGAADEWAATLGKLGTDHAEEPIAWAAAVDRLGLLAAQANRTASKGPSFDNGRRRSDPWGSIANGMEAMFGASQQGSGSRRGWMGSSNRRSNGGSWFSSSSSGGSGRSSGGRSSGGRSSGGRSSGGRSSGVGGGGGGGRSGTW